MAFVLMAEANTGHFDSKDYEDVVIDGKLERIYDRAKKAEFQAKVNKFDKTSGINPDIADCFKIVPGDGLSVVRSHGEAILDGRHAFPDDPHTEILPEDNQVYYYIIRSYVEYNPDPMQDRCMVEGTLMNPDPSSIPIREASVYDLVLAKIEVPAGTTQITDDMITDLRNNADYCGYTTIRANFDIANLRITADIVEDTDTKAIPTITGSPLEFLRGDGTWGGAPTMNVTADDVIPTATRAIPTITGSPLEFLRGDGTFSSLIKAGKYSFVPNGDNVDIITEVGDISNFAVPAYYRLLPPNGATVTNAANSLKPSTNTTYATFTQSGQQMNILYIYDGMPIFDEASKNITITVKIKYSATTSGITAFLYDLDTGADINTYKALSSTSGATQTITLSWAFTVFSNLNAKKIGLRICRTATSNMTFNVYGTDITVTQNVSGRVMAQLTPNGIEPNNTRMARIESAIDQILS